jgi:hypothetical protein
VCLYLFQSCERKDNLIMSSDDNNQEWSLVVFDSSNFILKNNNDTIINDFNAFDDKTKNNFLNDNFGILVTDSSNIPLSKSTGDIKSRVGDYYVRFSIENHFVGSCISRTVSHVGIMVSKYKSKDIPFVDIHFCAWKENGRVCAGIYNSGSIKGFCWKQCSIKPKDIPPQIAAALVAAGVSATVATAISIVIAPIAIGLSPVGL